MKFKVVEDFTNTTKRDEHYQKHVLGLDIDGELDPRPLDAEYFTSPEFYEHVANKIAKERVNNSTVFGFARQSKRTKAYAFYKFSSVFGVLVIYALGYHQDQDNPQIITMYKCTKDDYDNLLRSSFAMQNRGVCKVLHISKGVKDAAILDKQTFLNNKNNII